MKVFISLPINGYTDDENIERQQNISKKIMEKYNDATLICSFINNGTPLYYLGESLKKMASADICVFANEWGHVRGCRIEHECALLYGYKVIYEEEL